MAVDVGASFLFRLLMFQIMYVYCNFQSSQFWVQIVVVVLFLFYVGNKRYFIVFQYWLLPLQTMRVTRLAAVGSIATTTNVSTRS